jgi:hypothetical protein
MLEDFILDRKMKGKQYPRERVWGEGTKTRRKEEKAARCSFILHEST